MYESSIETNQLLQTETHVGNQNLLTNIKYQEISEAIRSWNKYFSFEKKNSNANSNCVIKPWMAIKISWKTYYIFDFFIYSSGCTFFLRKQILRLKKLLHHLHKSSCPLFSGHAVFCTLIQMSDNILIFTWLINSTRCKNANERKSLVIVVSS